MFGKDKIQDYFVKIDIKMCKFFKKLFFKNLSIYSMHLCVKKIWEELQLCAINIHNEKFFIHTVCTGS